MTRPALVALLIACEGAALAAPVPAPLPAASEPMIAYAVSAHDTLIGLNRTLFATPRAWPEVARINRLADPNRIWPGQQLMVPTRLLRSKVVPATVASVFGDVRVGDQPAAAGAELDVGTPIRTGAGSTAVVVLADGSHVRLAPDTEGRLDEQRRFQVKATRSAIDDGPVAATLRLLRGSVEVFATKVLRARPLEVSTPTAVIGVRGTSYRVRNDVAPAQAARGEVDRSATEVLEGKVHAQVGESPAAAADVPANFGATLEAGRAPAVVPLPPAPDVSGVPALVQALPFALRLPGDGPWRVQFADDAAFDHISVDLHVAAGDEIRVPDLADGLWHLRARRISPEGLEGLDGVATFEVRAQPRAPRTVEPPDGAKRMVGDVVLRWTGNPQATAYQVEVARDAAFTLQAWRADPVQAAEMVFHAVDTAWGAADGVYFWRVRSLRADGRAGPPGEAHAFILRPRPLAPHCNQSPDGANIECRWGGPPGTHVRTELARDPQFHDVAAWTEINGPRGRLPRPAAGIYWVRYRFIEPDGFETSWSDGSRVQVDPNWHEAIRALVGPSTR